MNVQFYWIKLQLLLFVLLFGNCKQQQLDPSDRNAHVVENNQISHTDNKNIETKTQEHFFELNDSTSIKIKSPTFKS